ncbi:MAG: DEAD/DEAH RNA helicase [Candidatus Collierbacteria bacterium GW2011_GWA1_44_12]|uniref:DEAD/DEAH RNA helicase n=1 Tax=Candidatus Collierbacteria bacterium GW2011_GWA1_44_12 TaxID=1618376 RepID=A0A0G1JLF6_9BACT|nr:MAG: DEAD/DEAH RNA helicase [Candidatus Collierbacteria bacterium GW2011_GWA1_44_12]
MFKPTRFGGRGARPGNRQHGSFAPRRNRFQPKNLDPRLFIKPATPAEAAEVNIENSFQDLGLHGKLLENLIQKGFTQPTPIQDKALIPALNGSDVLGLADTGTGKTAAFVLPILQKMIANDNQTALIIAPTRELAVQIRDEIRSLSTGLPIYTCILIGGSDIRRQIEDLRRRPHIYIGTPGRLKDLYNRRALNLGSTATVVLDEVDRMLDMGFINDITTLLSFVPKVRQTLLFSATIDNRVEGIAMQFMNNPVKISVKTGPSSHNVEQNIIRTSGYKDQKMDVLTDLLSKEEFKKVLIFGRTKYGVEEISVSLQKRGFSADAIHGNKRQNQRENVLRKFKTDQLKVLVATDVAARGIDVKDITHVINFDQPGSYDDYVHRIGRTGRAGKTGFALTFVD